MAIRAREWPSGVVLPSGKLDGSGPTGGAVCCRGAIYTAEVRRGRMGTGMPYWRSIFTAEEPAALVAYLWTFSLTHRE
jgi:hypothetical protein